MKVLALPSNSREDESSRLRSVQYPGALLRERIEMIVNSVLSESYLEATYSGRTPIASVLPVVAVINPIALMRIRYRTVLSHFVYANLIFTMAFPFLVPKYVSTPLYFFVVLLLLEAISRQLLWDRRLNRSLRGSTQ